MKKPIIPVWDHALAVGWHAVEEKCDQLVPVRHQRYKRAVVVGMGGSGIAGQLLGLMSQHYNGAPISVVDTPLVSHHYSDDALYIVCSYSGNTWETLSALEQLVAHGRKVVVITSGGQAALYAAQHDIPVIDLPIGLVPRAALPWFLGSMLAILDDVDLLVGAQIRDELSAHWRAVSEQVQCPEAVQPFLDYLGDAHLCHVWGVRGDTDAAAYRAQTQLNENSKMAAIYSTFPELNHNLLVGFTPQVEHAPMVLLMTEQCLPSLKVAAQSLMQVLEKRGIALYKPALLGDTWLQQVAYSVWWADAASYYIGCQRGHALDATVLIDQLKQTFLTKVSHYEEKPSS